MKINVHGSQTNPPDRRNLRPGCLSPENLSAEIDGEYQFSPAERQHLTDCPQCRSLYESYRVIDDAVSRSLDVNCPAAAAYRIRKNVNLTLDRMTPMRNHESIRFSALVARVAAVAVIAAMAGYLIFIDNPYSGEIASESAEPDTAAVHSTSGNAPSQNSDAVPGGVDIRNLRLASTGEGSAFLFMQPSDAPVKAEHVALIPDAVKHIWLFDPAWKPAWTEKILRNALKNAAVTLDQVRIAATPEGGLRVNLNLSRRQSVILTRSLAESKLKLVSPGQPQPEQRLFAGTGNETLEYEAVLLPRGK